MQLFETFGICNLMRDSIALNLVLNEAYCIALHNIVIYTI